MWKSKTLMPQPNLKKFSHSFMTSSDPLTTLRQLSNSGIPADQFCPQAVQCIQSYSEQFDWVGIYLLKGESLVLPGQYYVGLSPDHTRIPLDQGICGAAATEQKTIVVENVRKDPRYLACSIRTQSEVVVPILHDQSLYGVLDLDSDTPAAFQSQEIRFLESAADLIGAYFARIQ